MAVPFGKLLLFRSENYDELIPKNMTV